MKYLLWAVVIYLAWRWFSASRARPNAQGGDAANRHDPTSPGNGERMVECPECGLHLPLSEALPGPGEHFFCSEAHRNRHSSS